MPKPTKGPRLGGSPAHQRLILNNLASQLFEHGRITTTQTKAKRVQPLAEQLISKAKRGDLHNRRLVLARITNKSVVHSLFTEIAPRLADRDGGYTRITKIGNRQGDNAPMAVIEIVTETVEESREAKAKGQTPSKKATSATKASAKKSAAPVTVAEDDAVVEVADEPVVAEDAGVEPVANEDAVVEPVADEPVADEPAEKDQA